MTVFEAQKQESLLRTFIDVRDVVPRQIRVEVESAVPV